MVVQQHHWRASILTNGSKLPAREAPTGEWHISGTCFPQHVRADNENAKTQPQLGILLQSGRESCKGNLRKCFFK